MSKIMTVRLIQFFHPRLPLLPSCLPPIPAPSCQLARTPYPVTPERALFLPPPACLPTFATCLRLCSSPLPPDRRGDVDKKEKIKVSECQRIKKQKRIILKNLPDIHVVPPVCNNAMVEQESGTKLREATRYKNNE